MPTRKQRRRQLKERRHEYETVWVDEEGNELDEPPEDAVAPPREKRDPRKPAKSSRPQRPQRGARPTRVPPAPSWRRAIKRSVIWALVLAVLFLWIQSRQKHPSYIGTIVLIVLYMLLFPVFTYYLDRFVYQRYLRQQEKGGGVKKR
jgi:hypothetical protein